MSSNKIIAVDLTGVKVPKAKVFLKPFQHTEDPKEETKQIEDVLLNGWWASCIRSASEWVFGKDLVDVLGYDCQALCFRQYLLVGAYSEQGARLIIYYMEKLAENGKDFDFFLDNIIWLVKRTEMIRNPEVVVKICLGMENEKCKL